MSASILDDVRFPNGQFVDLQVGEPCSLDRDANRNAADGERADRESTDRRGDGQTPHLCADIPLKYLTFNFTSVRERVKSSILSVTRNAVRICGLSSAWTCLRGRHGIGLVQ